MKFKYKEVEENGLIFSRPIIPVEIFFSKEKHFKYETMVDSGSTHCFFDVTLAEAFEVNLKQYERARVTAFNGSVSEGRKVPISLKVGRNKFDITATFLYRMGDFGLLGHIGFFDYFIVKFDSLKGDVELKPRKWF